jgi:hypothetical protein
MKIKIYEEKIVLISMQANTEAIHVLRFSSSIIFMTIFQQIVSLYIRISAQVL